MLELSPKERTGRTGERRRHSGREEMILQWSLLQDSTALNIFHLTGILEPQN
jgi:hypothetical protein